MSTYEEQLRRLARVLSDIAHTLESVDGPHGRIERALALAKEILPYRRCALLEVKPPDTPAQVFVVPPVAGDERNQIADALMRVYRRVARADDLGRSRDTSASLTLPVIGLDAFIGVIRVEPDEETRYDATHLRILSIVAAQLGAYLTTLRLRELDKQRVDELAAAHDFQQRLAGIVSHDLRNPLAVITTVAATLLERAPDERQAQALRRALRNAEHASRLITDLLDVTESRVTGTIRIDPQRVDIADVVETSVDDLRNAHPQHTIELVIEVDRPAKIVGDRDRIEQLIANLVNNAVAHGAPGLPIEVALRPAHDAVTLSVHNFGPEIPADVLPTIFDPFRHGRELPRSRASRGLGLGLYIVSQIVEAHGGHVEVSSSVSTGTMFTVSLPRQARVETAERPVVAPAKPDDDALVMVVDDDEDVRVGITGLLEKRGYRVECAANGAEALQRLQRGSRPKLILLDMIMPGMDGAAFAQQCQRDPELAAIPIVAISADTKAAVRIERARAFLQKPVSVDRLLATLAEIR